jgi:hypothetical protein
VTTALQTTLLADSAALIELGRTQNALAFDAYLRGQRFVDTARDKEARSAEVAAYSEAIRLDPRYAKAYVGQSLGTATPSLQPFVECGALAGITLQFLTAQ